MKITYPHKKSAHKGFYLENKYGNTEFFMVFSPMGKYGMMGPNVHFGKNNHWSKVMYFPYLKWNAKHPGWLNSVRQFQDRLWMKLDTRYS